MIHKHRKSLTWLVLLTMLFFPLGATPAAPSVAGQSWSWGANDYGQLGTNNKVSEPAPVKPVNLTDALALAGGNSHSLAIRQDSSVWGWGANWAGQVGDNSTTERHIPVAVVLAGGAPFIGADQLAAGGSHSLALMDDQSLWAWGANWYGQLGDNSMTNRLTPIQVRGAGGSGFLQDVIGVAAGDGHSLALKSDGSVWSWGDNYYGQLGDNSYDQRNTPVQVKGPGGSGFLTNVVAISAGAFFSLALKADGTVWAWGQNENGQLGDNSTTERLVPVQVQNLSTVTAIAAGGAFCLARLSDGSLKAWGDNTYGQLGDNTIIERHLPVTVLQTGGGAFTGVSTIAAGSAHSLVMRSDSKAWAWGFNAFGQLGDTTIVDRHTPVQVATLTAVITHAAGYYHSLATDNNATAITTVAVQARWVDHSYRIEWWTASEIDLAGFNIYRAAQPDAEAVKINPELITPKAADSFSGAEYAYIESNPVPLAYFWLEEVDTHGRNRRFGPLTVGLAYLPMLLR